MNIIVKSAGMFAGASILAAVAFGEMAPDVTLDGFAVGGVKLMCRERNGWKVDFRREKDASGVEYAVVEMTRGEPDYPAAFNLSFNVPKLDTVAAWRPWSECSGFGMYWDPANLPGAGETDFRRWMPLYACYSSGGRNRMTFAASESSEPLVIKAGIREEDNRLYFSFHFYDSKVARRSRLVARLRIDARDLFWSDAVREAAEWMTSVSGRTPAPTPAAAFAPLYSTWYSFHQDVHQHEIERECAIASKMGMKTIIVDDGWQTDDTNRGYAFCGDWKESKNRFPDIKAHVARVHAMGMKYMLWYAVPWMGEKSANYARFKDKCLYHNKRLKTYCLDPRFPEVREFLISTYERALREWDIDGVKLDFIDSINVQGRDPAANDNFKGRDIKSVTEATERLISDIYKRLAAIKPDVLVEFRQAYIGPSIRTAANMLRVADCPADMQRNRRGIVNLRLTSGSTAVHSDMLEWHPTDTPEAAAKNVLNVMFSTVQYSMKLTELNSRQHKGGRNPVLGHADMIAHWSRFGAAHVDALQRGKFKPYHPELAYPLIEGESDKERIFGVYAAETAVSTGALDKPVYILNATDADSLVVEIPAKAKIVPYDTYGINDMGLSYEAGCHRVSVPPSGYLLVTQEAQR
ncbi:MAG: alpha-galactosidase [Kiritimatiellae bacterium]|nr:alpha-galactosidase [Kiritimatiellia bacterium]